MEKKLTELTVMKKKKKSITMKRDMHLYKLVYSRPMAVYNYLCCSFASTTLTPDDCVLFKLKVRLIMVECIG